MQDILRDFVEDTRSVGKHLAHCYFDHHQSSNHEQEQQVIGGYLPLEKVYSYDPVPPALMLWGSTIIILKSDISP